MDKGFLNMFDFELLQGNAATALEEGNHIVLTETYAKKLFGTGDALGKTVKIDSSDIFTVTGVMKDFPNTARMTASYILPWSYMKKLGWDDEWWGNNSVTTYVLLKPGATPEQFNSKVRTVTIDHTKESSKSTTEVFSYPLSRVYLYGKSENGELTDGRVVTVRLFAVIAVFILLIACINFMNLSTARSEKRAKEVGIRKVVGAGKTSLILQFIGESILLALMAGIVALIIVQISLPAFNNLVNKKLFIDYGSLTFWAQLTGFIFLTGILAGSYPAFFLSSFSPVKVLKGTFRRARAALDPRKVLVVLQFTFAIVLIISTLIIQRQIHYAQNRELGYNKNHLIYVSLQGDMGKHYTSIRQALVSSGAAEAVTKSMSPITERWSDSWGFSWPGSTVEDEKLDFIRFSTDGDFIKVMGTTLVEGRDIDLKKYATDSSAVLLNETAVKRMRLENPVGKVITNDDEKWTIVGVIKDFIIASPFDPVEPMIVNGPSAWFNVMHIRMNPDRATSDNLAKIQAVFEQFNPDYPFEYNFVDEEYATKFEDTRRTGTLASLFAILTIIISCLGLFGLSAYMAANRVKEIGVRKVLGASVTGISVLLSKDFLKLVALSFVIAAPIAWYAMKKWLDGYQYRMDM
ncbi:MAG: ABC transporter permease, partial [Leadbetterella sp.]|nr:ABC transporter permease [Leadbetterella sp.]